MSRAARLLTPDEVLLRRFGLVRAAGGAAYVVAVLALLGLLGRQLWPLVLGVPVLAGAATVYYTRSAAYPRTAVAVCLVADVVVLAGAIACLGGAGSGLVLLYTIVVSSAGILLGPAAATGFTGLVVLLALAELAAEQAGLRPVLGFNQTSDQRLAVFLVSVGGLASVGYLSGTYASRLHELIAEAGAGAETARVGGRQRRELVLRAAAGADASLRAVEEVADALEERAEQLSEAERRQLSGTLRIRVAQLDAEVAQLADVGSLDAVGEERPEPILLRRAVEDCVIGLGDRLEPYDLDIDVPPLKVLGHRRATRRVVFNLLDNAVTHTPPGTRVQVTALESGGCGVLVVTDSGPGILPEVAARMFDPPGDGGRGASAVKDEHLRPGRGSRRPGAQVRVGLPLVRQLCESMGAEIRYERAPHGGARFLVGFRLAPRAAPSPDDELV
ncbi:MAG: sensor histidine kinase [Egibacteraceae bacterium]